MCHKNTYSFTSHGSPCLSLCTDTHYVPVSRYTQTQSPRFSLHADTHNLPVSLYPQAPCLSLHRISLSPFTHTHNLPVSLYPQSPCLSLHIHTESPCLSLCTDTHNLPVYHYRHTQCPCLSLQTHTIYRHTQCPCLSLQTHTISLSLFMHRHTQSPCLSLQTHNVPVSHYWHTQSPSLFTHRHTQPPPPLFTHRHTQSACLSLQTHAISLSLITDTHTISPSLFMHSHTQSPCLSLQTHNLLSLFIYWYTQSPCLFISTPCLFLPLFLPVDIVTEILQYQKYYKSHTHKKKTPPKQSIAQSSVNIPSTQVQICKIQLSLFSQLCCDLEYGSRLKNKTKTGVAVLRPLKAYYYAFSNFLFSVKKQNKKTDFVVIHFKTVLCMIYVTYVTTMQSLNSNA